MIYIQRDASGAITGVFSCPQIQSDGSSLTEADPVSETLPEVLAYLNPPPLSADDLERIALGAMNGGDGRINMAKLIKAKIISDLSFRLGVQPAALTAQQLQNERARIAAIYKAL